VNSVHVSILDSNGNLLEQGAAMKQGTGNDWIYLATSVNPLLPGSRINVQVKDLPGNMTEGAAILS
jgi:hypothetical protein